MEMPEGWGKMHMLLEIVALRQGYNYEACLYGAKLMKEMVEALEVEGSDEPDSMTELDSLLRTRKRKSKR